MPESRLRFVSGLVGGVAAVALPLAALADPPLEKFTKDEVCCCVCIQAYDVFWYVITA